MGGGRPLEVPLASMGISCRGAVIVRTSPRVDKGQNKKPEPHWNPGPLFMPSDSEFPRTILLGDSVNRGNRSLYTVRLLKRNVPFGPCCLCCMPVRLIGVCTEAGGVL